MGASMDVIGCLRTVVLGILLATSCQLVSAEVTLPTVLAEHMVLQRRKPVHVWGSADPGESVQVAFRGNRSSAQADDLGRWSVYLPPGSAGGPFELTIRGKNEIVFRDVLVGDIWIASGQSNMEFPMGLSNSWHSGPSNMEQEIAKANHPMLRLFNSNGEWAAVREAQRKTLALVNTGMAVTIDVGDSSNIHPRDKEDVSHRLALWARSISYGENIEDSGPLFRRAVPERNQMRIWFAHLGGGLKAKGGKLNGFEVAGKDGRFLPASAKINDDTVVVDNPDVPSPIYVRYAWSSAPECNLFNKEDLPASPFTSDNNTKE